MTIGVFVAPGKVPALSIGGTRPLQPQHRIRHARRSLCPVFDRRAVAGGRTAKDSRWAADPPVARRQRSGDRRRQQRSDLRLHGRLGAARFVPPGFQHDRHLCRLARRRLLSDADPQNRAQAAAGVSGRRQRRPEQLRRRLVDGQSNDGAGSRLFRLRSQSRLGRRGPQPGPRPR